MNTQLLKNDIFDANHPERQIKAAYQMRYAQNDPEVVKILFGACYEAKNPKLQQEAVRSLGILKPDRAIEDFSKSTYNYNAGKRMRAYYHLGTLGDPKALDTVLKGLSDPDEKVRKAAVVSAGRLGRNFRVINALNKLLNGFEPEPVKSAARISIDMIKKKMNGNRSFNGKRSFDKPKGDHKYPQRSFNKPDNGPKAYTPKGF